MPEQVEQCVKSVMEEHGRSEEDAWAICQAQFTDQRIHRHFEDRATFNATDKTAISVRDGVIEYMGAELGLEPADRIFTVYRSPATIANACRGMVGISLTDEHVPLDGPPPDTGSFVTKAWMVDLIDPATDTCVAIKNQLSVSDEARYKDQQQLSLGYMADLVPHDTYDFEQVDIVPHHLAAVPVGRCGPLCSFLDRGVTPQEQEKDMSQQETKLPKAFYDAEGEMSLEQIVEIATALPEAIKSVPVDKLREIMPSLQEVVKMAREQGVTSEEEQQAAEDEGMEKEEEEKEGFSDQAFNDAVQRKAKEFADAEVKRYAQVVDKARQFLDESYDFKGKTSEQVMRDALATETTEQFQDEELPLAFKLLKRSASYKDFGDSGAGSVSSKLDEIGEKELS